MNERQYRHCMGLFSGTTVKATDYDDIYRIVVPSETIDGAGPALRSTLKGQAGRHGRLQDHGDTLVLRTPTDPGVVEEALAAALSETLTETVAGPDVPGLFRPDEWPEDRGRVLFVDASHMPRTNDSGVGVCTYQLGPGRADGGLNRYPIQIPDQPGSFQAETVGLACALSIAAEQGVTHPMIVGDNIAANREFSRGYADALQLDCATLFEGLASTNGEKLFEDVHILSVHGTHNAEADTLADRGRENGAPLNAFADVPDAFEAELSGTM